MAHEDIAPQSIEEFSDPLGVFGAKSSRLATEAQLTGTRESIAEQRRQFDITQQQLAPFREAGVSALGQQQLLLGLTGTPEEQQAAMSAFAETPGQKFLRAQQKRALLRSASAIGGLGGGNIRSALQEQAFSRAQTDFGTRLNRLADISGTGQTATTDTAQFGAGASARISQALEQAGQTRASGLQAQQQAKSSQIQTGIGLASIFFG